MVTKRLVPVQRGDAGVAGNLLGGKLEHVGVLGKGRADEAVGQLGALEAAVRLSLEQEVLARLLVEAAGDVGAFGQEQGAHLALHESEPDGFQVR